MYSIAEGTNQADLDAGTISHNNIIMIRVKPLPGYQWTPVRDDSAASDDVISVCCKVVARRRNGIVVLGKSISSVLYVRNATQEK